MARYLVTGGCGFIGSRLVEHLAHRGHEVIVLDNLSTGRRENVAGEFTLIVGDIRDKALLKKCFSYEIDGCFHLAAVASVKKSSEDWSDAHSVNASGSINIFDCAKENKTPVVYASSAAVYGDNIDTPLKEGSITNPINAYGADKLSTEFHARVASLSYGIPTIGLRLFNVYGPARDPKPPYSDVISIFLQRILHGEDILIYGDGQQTRDFVYIEDVVKILLASMINIDTCPLTMNVCTGKAISIEDLAKLIMRLTGESSEIRYSPVRLGDISTSVGDHRKINKFLSLTTNYSIYKGVSEILEGYTQDIKKVVGL